MTKTKLLKILKKISANIIVVISSIVVALILVEIVLRFTPYKNIGERSYRYPSNYFVADEEIGYDIVRNFEGATHGLQEHPYKVFSNSYGCFDYEREVPDNYGIIVGDSFTWGYTPLEKKWTTYLEKKSNIFMLKCGITGHGTMQEMRKAKRTIKEVGKNPKYITVLYTSNDFNDNFMFPSRTVIGEGKLVNKNKGANLITGKRFFYTDEELKEKHKKYMGNNLDSYLRKFRYGLVTYRVFRNVQPKIKTKLKEFKKRISGNDNINKKKNIVKNNESEVAKQSATKAIKKKVNQMPDYTKGYYNVYLTGYFDQTDRAWYNKAVEDHKNNIREFALYAKSVNAKFLFVDLSGTLSHKRFDDLRQFFSNTKDVYYYNLGQDYKNQSTWKYDGHWDIKGNQEAGEYIYQHFKKIRVFK